ncbi:hypothetical protein TKK_0002446 [Trichogramma kaykai]
MYSQYKTLASQKPSQSKINEFVKNADFNELCQMVLKVLNTSEVTKVLDDVLRAFGKLYQFHDKRLKLIIAILDALKNIKAPTKHVDSIVSRIVIDFSQYERTHLVKLIDYCIERIRNNDDEFMSWKDIIPLVLEKLEEEKTINHRGTDVTGKEYKNIIIRSLCDIDWNPKTLSSLAKMFVDIITDVKDKSNCEIVMRALANKMMIVDLSELPPLVHQMLKLGSEHNITLLYSKLARYFAKNYSNACRSDDSQVNSDSIVDTQVSLEELQQTESTVLYHIYQSALDNTKSSLDYIKCLKSVVNAPEYILDPFVMSVLLLLSSLFEDQSLQILKQALQRQIQDEENQSHSAWLRRVSSDDISATETINRVIENSNKDRQLVLKGLVDFGFVLLGIERKCPTEKHLPWEYGSQILQKISRKRQDAGGTVLEILVDKIVRAGSNVTQYTDCLTYMCRKLTMTVLEHQVWINSLMEQLLVIPGSAASLVLQAILPLMRISGSIRDNLIMVLRKALYRKGVETRRMAVLGFLQLLKNLKLSSLTALSQSESLSSSNVASSSSFFTQATLERPSQKSNPWQNTCLCREILAILSKCFTHELEVRSHLYQELYHGIIRNPELTEYIVEFLLEHFYKYFENDEEVLPPLWFEKCSSIQGIDVVIHEPIAELIFALQKIYLKVASKESMRVDKLAAVLDSLCKRMTQTDLEHFGIDEDTDLSDNTPKTQLKIINVKLAISVYESLLTFRIASWSQNSENICGSIISLFKGYSRLVEFFKKLGKSKKGGKGKKDKEKDANDTTIKKGGKGGGSHINAKLPNTVMDLDAISKCINILYKVENPLLPANNTEALRGRIEFHQYILQSSMHLFQHVKTLKDHNLTKFLETNKHNFFNIGAILFKNFIMELKTISSFNEQLAGLGLECFKECCEIMCTTYSSELPAFLEAITGEKRSNGLSFQLQSLISPLKDIFVANIDAELPEEVVAQKVPLHVIEIISKLVKKIPFDDVKCEKVFDWLNEIAEKSDHLDVQVSAIIIQLILLIEERSIDYSETIQDICVEFCAILGKTDNSDVTSSRKYHIINEATIAIAYLAVNKILATKLQNVIWLLGRLNAEYVAMTSLEADDESNRKKIKDKEQILCRQFSFILSTFELLANVKIMPGQLSDALFKNLKNVYNFACSLAKYFKKKSTATNPAFQSVKFIPVIQGAGSALKQAIHELILHIETSQNIGKSTDTNVQRNKILKEVMVIPGVVQAIDTFDKEIILLAKKTNVDLMKYTKYDAIRDFRIKNSQVLENLANMNVSQLNNTVESNADASIAAPDISNQSSEESESNSDSDEGPATKRKRRS